MLSDGKKIVLFRPLEPYEASDAISSICESYNHTLAKEENDPKPFIKYMLGISLSCYREFESRVNLTGKAGVKSTAYDIVKKYTLDQVGTFTKQDALIS